MARLGSVRAYVVHGSDGLGELTITGPSAVFAVQHGTVSRIELVPGDFGLKQQKGNVIPGGDAEQNRGRAAIAATQQRQRQQRIGGSRDGMAPEEQRRGHRTPSGQSSTRNVCRMIRRSRKGL